jgi:CRP/FNR family transcriptional regulator, cyclic AMP receptor protein
VEGAQVIQLLDCDPELGEGLSADDRVAASAALPVQAASLEKGQWEPSRERPNMQHLGFLIVRGLVARRVEVVEGASIELLGRGDVLQPWQEDASSFCTAAWEVLEKTTLAVLGPGLVRGLRDWPVVASNLSARGIRRSRALAADAAIASIVGVEERLLILLWHIAERWGEAKRDGAHISIHLPHRLLADLVGARRPSVTSALSALQEAGRLDSTASGCWVLLGDPPC